MDWKGGKPNISPLFSKFVNVLLEKPRKPDEPLTQKHKDIAASVQSICEQTIFHLAENLYKRTGLKNLCITGGVGQNSVANGKNHSIYFF